MREPERLLTHLEAAELLGLSKSGLRKMEREGRGPRITRIGRLVRYSPAELWAFIESHTQGGTK